MTNTLEVPDFANLFGIDTKELPDDCLEMIRDNNFNYLIIGGQERDKLILNIFKKIDAGEFSIAGEQGLGRWEKGWGESLNDFLESGFDISQLIPKYIRSSQPVRLFQQYVQPEDDSFELNWYKVFRRWLFRTYLSEVDAIYEFGCGSGFNLVTLAELFPKKVIFGMDWVKQSVDIVNKLAESKGYKTKGKLFDFFNPDQQFQILPNSAVITIGALEQTGKRYRKFLDYLIRSKPAIVINIEPTVEWYDANNLVDYAAIRFHLKRNYWQGFPTALEKLRDEEKVEILKQKRSYFGSLYVEGYSQSIWRPI
ncbi:MAG TPA: class I SAM-dependent methyltransferase [Anaerolineae bacterium]|nr:class I SAM-dependent methyltransferase [Anaerolineae bacterium]